MINTSVHASHFCSIHNQQWFAWPGIVWYQDGTFGVELILTFSSRTALFLLSLFLVFLRLCLGFGLWGSVSFYFLGFMHFYALVQSSPN